MAEEGKRKGGGGKLSRTEVVGLRMDPRLRYMAELGARKQRRTLSSFIEWAVEDVLSRISLGTAGLMTIWDESQVLWDPHPAIRYFALAGEHPELLTFSEQKIEGVLDDMLAVGTSRTGRHAVSFRDGKNEIDKQLVRDCWDEILQFVEGEIDADALRAAMLKKDTSTDDKVGVQLTDRLLSYLEQKGGMTPETFAGLKQSDEPATKVAAKRKRNG